MQGKPQTEVEPKGGMQLEVAWAHSADLAPVFVDNLHLALVNNQYYLTFGQLRISTSTSNRGEIHPVACFVIPRDALANIASLLSKSTERHQL